MTAIQAEVEQRVLILAPIGRDASAAADQLQRNGIAAVVCAGLDDLCTKLREGAGVCVVTEEALVRGGLHPVREWAQAEPPWSDLPFIVLTGLESSTSLQEYRLRLINSLGNASLLARPLSALSLLSAVQAGLRSRARQYEVREYLRERESAAARLERLIRDRTQELEKANERLRQEIVERQQAESALQQAQKMEVIGQMTGGVAHDFNNLLTAVMGNLDMAIRRNSDEGIRRFLDRASQAANRGAKLISQLLAFSRRQLLRSEPVDLNLLISRMGDLLIQSAGSKVRIETILQEGLWPAMADPNQIELVLLNLVVNSRDAMPEGGSITIATSNSHQGDPTMPVDLVGAEHVVVSVRDTGMGMTEEVLKKAFEPFFTTKPVGKGTGLGLSQVYGIVKQSNGAVAISSAPDRGTTVAIYLPRAENGSAALPFSTLGASPVEQNRPRILVVDDDPDVLEFAASCLDSLGYETRSAGGARAAFEIAEQAIPLDLLLIDVVMPEMNGRHVSRHILERRPGLPVLYMSGYVASPGSEDPQHDTVLQKPFTMTELARAVQEALNTHPPGGSSG